MAQIDVTFCCSVGLLKSVRMVVWYGTGRVPVACGCCWPDSPAGHCSGGTADGTNYRQLSRLRQERAGRRHLVLAASSTAKKLCRLP